MCGRFNLRLTPAELQEFFDLCRVPQFSPRYNISPGTLVLSIRQMSGGREADFAMWGHRAANPAGRPLSNAKAETVFRLRSFGESARQRRCLIPVQGFYEWQEVTRTAKQPYHIFLASEEPMAFAGICDANGAVATMTTQPNAEMAQIHDRMPVILAREAWDLYLDPEVTDPADIEPLLVPLPDGSLRMAMCDPVVNNARNETPNCIRPFVPPVRPTQKSLFGGGLA